MRFNCKSVTTLTKKFLKKHIEEKVIVSFEQIACD